MTLTSKFFLLYLFWHAALILGVKGAHALHEKILNVQTPRSKLYRSLRGISTRSAVECGAPRNAADYPSELQLVYVYLFESKLKTISSLQAMEDAISVAIASVLNDCDIFGRPLYQIKTTTRHEFSKTEYCPPSEDGNTCSVINGATAILLENQPFDVQEVAYLAISDALNNTDFIKTFDDNVVRAKFVRPEHESLLSSSEDSKSQSAGTITATVAIAAASVIFVVASIFCYGVLRYEIRSHPEPSVRHRNKRSKRSVRAVVSSAMEKPRSRFVRLDEFAMVASAPFTTKEGCDHQGQVYSALTTPSITWSVSDMTLDSLSVRSSLSRLERIVERDDDATTEKESLNEAKHTREGSPIFLRTKPTILEPEEGEFHDAKDLEHALEVRGSRKEIDELEGCQFVLDDCKRGFANFDASMFDCDDLQVSMDDDEKGELEEILSTLFDIQSESDLDSEMINSFVSESSDSVGHDADDMKDLSMESMMVNDLIILENIDELTVVEEEMSPEGVVNDRERSHLSVEEYSNKSCEARFGAGKPDNINVASEPQTLDTPLATGSLSVEINTSCSADDGTVETSNARATPNSARM